jgi:hypothetical protein
MIVGQLLAALLAVVVTTEAGAATAAVNDPFFMFTTSEFATADEAEAVGAALRRHTTSGDYLGVNVALQFPDLAARVSRSHVYALPPNLAGVEHAAAANCSTAAGLIIYNGEHWQQTPPDEQVNMPKAIERGKAILRQTSCRDYGIAPDGLFLGISPETCRYDPAKSILRAIDWTGVTLFDIQAQRLRAPNCVAHTGIGAYVAMVRSVASDVRSRLSYPKIVAQLSFRLTPPDQMIAAIRQLNGIVDGLYIAYPRNVGPSCPYCAAANLDQVLGAIHL